jgi:hypothetical protein
VGEYREGESRFQELLEAPFPRAAGEFAERTIDQTREAYERCSRTLDVAVQILGNSFAAAGQGAAALRRNILDTAHGQLNLSFDLVKSLAAATNLSEIVQLQAACWQSPSMQRPRKPRTSAIGCARLAHPRKPSPRLSPFTTSPSKRHLLLATRRRTRGLTPQRGIPNG